MILHVYGGFFMPYSITANDVFFAKKLTYADTLRPTYVNFDQQPKRMKTVNDVFSAFKLKKARVNRISKEVKDFAIETECEEDNVEEWEEKELSKETRSLLLHITDKIWAHPGRYTHSAVLLDLSIFEVFPHAYYFLHSPYLKIRIKAMPDPILREFLWKQLVKYLSGESCYADQVKFALWNYYFDDPKTVCESWQGLINTKPEQKALLNILEVAACVPWDLKEPMYYSLLDDETVHDNIFYSMFSSAFDEGGKIRNKKAYTLLLKLSIDPTKYDYQKLARKINKKGSYNRFSNSEIETSS